MHKKSYLRDTFNVLDFTIIVVTGFNWILGSLVSDNIGFIKAFRAVRAIRPLKVVSRNQGMKDVINSIFKSMP